MQVDLIIPDLIWPDAALPEIYQDLPLPSLSRLLGRARIERLPAGETDNYLLAAFGQAADTGLAMLTASADGLDVDQGFWLRADPVHLQLGHDALVLADSGIFTLSQQEADQLVATLNRHFADDGLTFHAPHPVRWYVRLPSAPAMTTHRLGEVIGRNIDDYLPAGPDGMHWHGILNEIQMLFFEHPVNTAREMAGDTVINSIWLWGEGRQAVPLVHVQQCLVGDDPLLQALAHAGGIKATGLPGQVQALIEAHAEESLLVVCDTLRDTARYDDAHGWRERLLALEQDWFSPLLAALDAGRIKRLRLIVPGQFQADTAPGDRWHFWRRPRALVNFASLTKTPHP